MFAGKARLDPFVFARRPDSLAFFKNSYDYLLQRKTLQVQPDIVKAMSLELALYFHRAHEPKAAA